MSSGGEICKGIATACRTKDVAVRIPSAKVCGIDWDARRCNGGCLECSPFLLYVPSLFDEGTDECLGIAVDGGDDGRRDGLGYSLVYDLVDCERALRRNEVEER